MPTKHAKLSASGSARWLNCPGSIGLSEHYPASTSKFAEEGTCAHELGEICLKDFDKNPSDFIGQTLNDAPDISVDAEMVTHVEGYIDYCRQIIGDMFVEEQVDFSPWVPEGFGTSDCIIFSGQECHVIDLKYGKGVEVYAERNTQAMLYALGVLNDYGFMYEVEKFTLHIYQPRRNHVDEWSITRQELLEWAEWAKERALLALSDNAPVAPGDKQCQWCPHKPNCLQLQKYTEEIISSEFDDLDLPPVESVDVQNILKHKSLIEAWLKAVEQQAYERLMKGDEVDGYKLVAGRSVRKWGDAEIAETLLAERLGDALYTKKMVSPTQAEKLLGKAEFKEFGDLVVKPEGKPTIAPSIDKRPPIGDVTCEFEEL